MVQLSIVGALSLFLLGLVGVYYILEWSFTRVSYTDFLDLHSRVRVLEEDNKTLQSKLQTLNAGKQRGK